MQSIRVVCVVLLYTLFYSAVLRVFTLCVLVHSGFMYRGLTVL